ncbi:hypothetical protein [uncultured Tateyamaria sp.]|uniref:hypothetical protein n=1 Tax=uncultured Tateyamaria sp. TaxID=455651 RepID=UPI00261EC370|nr:hypothetical protein [uncultured Tateyamaria sp.]
MPWRVALAQELSGQALVDVLVARTPGTTLDRMRTRPEAFVEEAAGLILGYGGGDGLRASHIEQAIAAELARLRAREMRRLLEADLNGDLGVTQSELNVLLRAASATMRGRLLVWFRAADVNGDHVVAWSEMRAHASRKAHVAMGPHAADAMRAMMTFDLDHDGAVEMSEVLDAMNALKTPS